MKKYNLFLIAFFCLITSVARSADIPYLSGRVNDYAGILSDSTRIGITEKLKEHELKTTNQVVVLTIKSLEGETIEDFAYKVFNDWKLGQKDKETAFL